MSNPVGSAEQTQMDRKHLSCIDGAAEFLEILRQLFEDALYNVTTTNSVPRTFEQIESLQPDGIILDLAITHQAGWGMLERLARESSTRDIPLITGSTDQSILDLVRSGGKAYLMKPFDLDAMIEMVHRVVGES